MVCANGGESLPPNDASPPYEAVMEWRPTDRPDVENTALASAPTVAVPRTVSPSLNVTTPLGARPPAPPITDAVKVTSCPALEVAARDDDELIAEHARWAIGEIWLRHGEAAR